jgi:hypothetical protein
VLVLLEALPPPPKALPIAAIAPPINKGSKNADAGPEAAAVLVAATIAFEVALTLSNDT